MSTPHDEDWLTWSDFQVGDVFVHRHQSDMFALVSRSEERFDTFNMQTGVHKVGQLHRIGVVPRGYDVYRDGVHILTT